MAKYIEVISGEYKGMHCYVRSKNDQEGFYITFDNILLKKTDCKVIEYERTWKQEKDPGCRYRE